MQNTNEVKDLQLNKPQFLFHKCPRCNGRLYLEKDQAGSYESCLFCGYSKDLEPVNNKEKIDWGLPQNKK